MDSMEDPQRTPTTTAKKGRKASKLRSAPVSSADVPKVGSMEALGVELSARVLHVGSRTKAGGLVHVERLCVHQMYVDYN